MRSRPAAAGRSFVLTFIAVVFLAAFLSPLIRAASVALKTPEQISQVDSPIWPADPVTFTYAGRPYDVYTVPLADGTTARLALVTKGRSESKFADPAAGADGPLITWQGSWRTLEHVWTLSPTWSNFGDVWTLIDYPRLLFNTIAIALIGTIGTIISCTLVAYGFARFRFPGRGLLFTLLIATIFLPAAVTVIPTYTLFAKLGWVGTWLPLLVPTFFANAYDVFLLRYDVSGYPFDFGTYFGGQGSETSTALGLLPGGAAFITGVTASGNYPVLSAFQPNFGGGTDGFITKITGF